MCIDSMVKQGTPLDRLVVVDNCSTDGTRDYLATLPLGGRIFNASNLGCGTAWNQGALALQSEWSIIMNNDVLVSPLWIENLIHAAESKSLRVISPALIEGPLDYDFDVFSQKTTADIKEIHRLGSKHAVCLAIHNSVWMDVGYFQPIPKLLGYEDTLFFNELKKSNIQTSITGASWLHHFGSITQTAMKQERGLSEKDGLANRYNYKLLNQSWIQRKLVKIQAKKHQSQSCQDEVKKYGMSVHGLRKNHTFEWI
ncbi:putative glycosyltransferase [Polynucleobacter duraquae]|uniref:Glycosyltransferase n=2 Tax=Polynucleobacter duraquae TaxID=1835254 RepID=A0A0E3UZP7_9BURK|nr:putative glycosyltransferase [Polynucleobacter duraquae]